MRIVLLFGVLFIVFSHRTEPVTLKPAPSNYKSLHNLST